MRSGLSKAAATMSMVISVGHAQPSRCSTCTRGSVSFTCSKVRRCTSCKAQALSPKVPRAACTVASRRAPAGSNSKMRIWFMVPSELSAPTLTESLRSPWRSFIQAPVRPTVMSPTKRACKVAAARLAAGAT